jgi:Ca-activated chloride channel family protein
MLLALGVLAEVSGPMKHRSSRIPAASAMLAAIVAAALATSVNADGTSTTRSLPTFSSALDVVNLNVSVSDAKEKFVTGLAADDFKIFEDGIPQQLCLFTQERLPLSLAILIDSSMSMQPNLPAVRAAAIRLTRALQPIDQAEIIQFNHKFAVIQDFTADQTLLANAINGINAEGATGLYNALYLTLKDPHFRRKDDQLTRQAVVILTDGEDTSSMVSDDQVLELARKSNVTIFAISLRQPRPSLLDSDAPDRATYFLSSLTRDSGGRSYFPSALAQIDGVYGRIADELRTQYAIGYVSSNTQHDGKWRNIAIETTQGHLMLRHKLGYYAGGLRSLRSSTGPASTGTTAATSGVGTASTLPRRQLP